jgi:Radical SAM superfamily/4Fe-4S single cluster domain
MNFTTIPFDKITRFGQRTMLANPLFSTSWILGRFCNYNCSYCWPHARSDFVDHKPLELYKHTIDEIKRQARQNGFTHFHWSFSGGEPTAYKDLINLIAYLDDGIQTPYQSVHMTTNLSPGSKWWKSWCSATEMLQRRSITASYHHEFAKEQEFGDKCLQLMYEQVHVTINQVMVPENFWSLYDRMEQFHARGINVTLKPQSDPTASFIVNGYTDEMIKIMQNGFKQQADGENVYQIALYDADGNEYLFDQAERFNAFGFNKFTNWHCNSGFQSVIIRENDVKRAYSCHDNLLGTLTEGFTLFDYPRQCKTPTCVSSADSKIPKCK